MKTISRLALGLFLITLAACAELPFTILQPAAATPTADVEVIATATTAPNTRPDHPPTEPSPPLS